MSDYDPLKALSLLASPEAEAMTDAHRITEFCKAAHALEKAAAQPAPDDGKTFAMVYGFAAWLTTLDGAMQIGAKHDAKPMAKAVGEWIDKFGSAYTTRQAKQ